MIYAIQKLKYLWLTTATVLVVVSVLAVRQTNAAGSNTFSLSSSASTITQNETFVVTANLTSTSDAITSGRIYVTFDTSKVAFVSASFSGSPWTNDTGETGEGNGYYQATRYKTPPYVTGTNMFVKITFKALVSGGSTSLSVNNGNSLINDEATGGNVLTGSTGVSVSFKAPTTTAPSTPTPSKPSTTPSSPTTPSTQPTTQPTIMPEVTSSLAQDFGVATVTVSTTSPVKAKLLYGLKDKLEFESSEVVISQTHPFIIESKYIAPGFVYQYKVVFTDTAGTVKETPIETFRAKGFRVRMRVLDASGKPLAKKKAVLYSEPIESETDDEGYVTFEDVHAGEHTLKVQADDNTEIEQSVAVTDNRTFVEGNLVIPVQEQEVVFGYTTSSSAPLLQVLGAIGLIAVCSVAGFIVIRARAQKQRVAHNPVFLSPLTPQHSLEAKKKEDTASNSLEPLVIKPSESTDEKNHSPEQ